MTSIKIKFRPSSVEGKEGSIHFRIIHNRVVRQLNTAYRIFASEWDEETETIIANGDRINIINAIRNGWHGILHDWRKSTMAVNLGIMPSGSSSFWDSHCSFTSWS